MVIKSNSIKGNVYFVLLGLLLSVVVAGAADAFYFRGYTYNETNFSLRAYPAILAVVYIFEKMKISFSPK